MENLPEKRKSIFSALDFTLCMRDFLTMAEIQRKVCTRLLRVCNQLSTSLAMFQKLVRF